MIQALSYLKLGSLLCLADPTLDNLVNPLSSLFPAEEVRPSWAPGLLSGAEAAALGPLTRDHVLLSGAEAAAAAVVVTEVAAVAVEVADGA